MEQNDFLKNADNAKLFIDVNKYILESAEKIADDYYHSIAGNFPDDRWYIDSTSFSEDSTNVEISYYASSGCGCCGDEHEYTMSIPVEFFFNPDITVKLAELKQIADEKRAEIELRKKQEAEQKAIKAAAEAKKAAEIKDARDRVLYEQLKRKYE